MKKYKLITFFAIIPVVLVLLNAFVLKGNDKQSSGAAGQIFFDANAWVKDTVQKSGNVPERITRLLNSDIDARLVDSLRAIGYDPEFKKKLKLTAEYEENIPEDTIAGTHTRASVELHQGVPTLYVNGNPVYTMLLMPSHWIEYRPEGILFNVCRDFAAAGINLYGEWFGTEYRHINQKFWLDEGLYDFAMVDRRMHEIIEANPNALIIPWLKLDPPINSWIERHPDETSYFLKDGKVVSSNYVSLASELWESTYERMLRDFVRHIESSDYADHVLGYRLCAGRASEWYWYGQGKGDIDYGPAARDRFRKWLKEKYKNDHSLQAAWHREDVTLDSAEFPTPETRRTSEYLTFRDPRKAKEYFDARQFLIDMTTHNIIKSCSIVKEETKGQKLTGVYYGYSLLRAGNTYLGNNGQADLARVLASPAVDFLGSPIDYKKRRGGQPGNMIGGAYISSIRLHNKLGLAEHDLRTHFYNGKPVPYNTETLEESLSVIQRAVGWSLTKGNALYWFPIVGNAHFHQEDMMQTIASLKKSGDNSINFDKSSASEVALFADEKSLNYLAYGETHPVVRASMWGAYENATHMGTPFDLYLLQDIANKKLPDYKVYIFLDTYYTTPDLRQAINAKVKKNNAVAVWLYAPGFVTDDGLSEETMQELTGITIRHEKKQAKSVMKLTNMDHPITALAGAYESSLPEELNIEMGPRFWVEDPEALTLGECEGRPALVVKEEKGWRSVYSAFPLTKELLQGICDYAGVHVYSRDYDVFFANKSYAMLHAVKGGKKTISLPGTYHVKELTTGKEPGKNLSKIKIKVSPMETRIFQLEPTKH